MSKLSQLIAKIKKASRPIDPDEEPYTYSWQFGHKKQQQPLKPGGIPLAFWGIGLLILGLFIIIILTNRN